MKNCKDCLSWQQERNSNFGKCKDSHFKYGYGWGLFDKDLANDNVIVENDEGWGMFTGSMFGCIHHSRKEASMLNKQITNEEYQNIQNILLNLPAPEHLIVCDAIEAILSVLNLSLPNLYDQSIYKKGYRAGYDEGWKQGLKAIP